MTGNVLSVCTYKNGDDWGMVYDIVFTYINHCNVMVTKGNQSNHQI